MAGPPAPIPGSDDGGSSVSVVTEWIKAHYIEVFLIVLAIYISYYMIMELSKFLFKPAYLINPERGTKRYIGRVLYSKVVKGKTDDEYRAFVKDGIFGQVIPHLFVDMDRVKVRSNMVSLDYTAIVYDHERHMFVGSLTGAEDKDLDGEAVELRTKNKLRMNDVLVSMAVKSCPSISQHHLLSSGIPISDELYQERLPQSDTEQRALPGDAEGPDHVAKVIEVKEIKKEQAIQARGGSVRPVVRKRFVVRPKGSNASYEDAIPRPVERPVTPEPEPSPVDVIEKMPIGQKIKGLFEPALSGNEEPDESPEG